MSLVPLLHYVSHIQDDIRVSDCRVDEVHHVLLQPVVGLEDSGGVGVDYLVVFPVYYPHYPVPRGLGLGCHNGQLFPDQGVHQSGFAYIRVPDYVHKPCTVLLFAHVVPLNVCAHFQDVHFSLREVSPCPPLEAFLGQPCEIYPVKGLDTVSERFENPPDDTVLA